MHTVGKVLAVLVVIAAIIASLFTAKLIQVRNTWTAKTATAKQKYNDAQPKIEALEANIDKLRNEIFRSRELWGSALPKVQTTVNADGSVGAGIGSDQGIRPAMLLHGFDVGQDGSSIYRGSFLVADVQKDASVLKPNFRATPEDIKSWGPGGPWRWRNSVPPGYLEIFDRQLLAILKDEETLRARSLTLEAQKQLLTKANSTLKLREAELVGGEGLAQAKAVDPEFVQGLVPAVEQTEEVRNKILVKNDELRREVRRVEKEIERLQTENQGLIQRLAEPSPRATVTQNK